LYFGVPVTWLISAKYPVIIDPTNEFYFNKEIDYYSIYNDLNRYYFNATDAQQMINHFQDYWSKNEICIGFYINRWREYCTDAVDWTWYNSTDYSSYVNLTGVAEAFYGKDWYQKTSNYRVRVFLEHYLESDSPDVKVSVKIQNVGKSDIQDTYIKVWTHDIRVNLTYDNDTFRVNTTSFWEAWSGWKQYLLDQSGLDLFYTENDLVTRKYAIFDNTTESWVEMEWNDSYWKNGIGNSMNYNLTVKKGTEANAPVDLVFLTGSLNKNDVISTNFKWADAIKQNFTEAYETYNEITEWTLDRIYDSFENGTDFYIQDFNMTVEMKSTGIVNVKYNFISVNENITYLYSFFEIAHKFGCYEYLKLKEIIKNSTYCPENETTYEQISYDLAKEEATLSNIEPGQVAFKYTLPNMTVDDSTGVGLLSYKSNLVPTENETYKKTRIKLPSVFSTKNYEDLREFDIDFGYTGTSHCIKVPINQFSNFTLNVTMLAPVANHTFSRDDFVLENYTLGNSLIAKIKPYPCCGIATDKTLEVEVCS